MNNPESSEWTCQSCRGEVREPGRMGRSWCSRCEDYAVAIEIPPTSDENLLREDS